MRVAIADEDEFEAIVRTGDLKWTATRSAACFMMEKYKSLR
ncbi:MULTISPECIES: hypothetical protein [Desertifilum]|uniref:Uncharacterized protein n=1 Tax=Desertifilum tharense IPPAS B-1220 TaxID=1781255 RepID=A0ACD5GY08_9CYAN|nr:MULTISPECIES: hypothetical protein [Desertifilum]MDA0213675.1 hypothetical protein [Cyanobacteria bacterium FC1]